jgi:sulfur transfer complex TusBCD TusB component (DsrH family)
MNKKKKENVVLIQNGIFTAMKKNKILSFANKWMELKNVILSEVSQAQKKKICMFSPICGL